jgi:hypothetical protein
LYEYKLFCTYFRTPIPILDYVKLATHATQRVRHYDLICVSDEQSVKAIFRDIAIFGQRDGAARMSSLRAFDGYYGFKYCYLNFY